MKLLVGLGNPGSEYAGHRHNVGFMALDEICSRHGFQPWRRRFQGHTSEGDLSGTRVLLLKPGTYMNESGRAVGDAARFLKIGLEDIIVFHDELDLAPGKIKLKTGGGNAGHNGLRSISAHLGNEYVRVRIGIGHPGHKDAVSQYVLHDFAKADRVWLDPLLDAMAKASPWLVKGDQSRFLTDVARLTSTEADEPAPKRGTSAAAAEKVKTGPHPGGERMGKRQSALAENLKKWLRRGEPSE